VLTPDLSGRRIHWVIVGAESGPKRRPMCPTWANRVKTQCQGTSVAFFMKQMEVGGKITDDIEQFPADLRIRQFPTS
jgi:protein gp37